MAQYVAFNRGLISTKGLGRIDLKRTGLSAETYTNWIPRVLGSMMLRPGLGYIGSVNSPRFIPFVKSLSDKALVELTNGYMRVWISDTILTRSGVSTAITNGTFTSDVTGWTDSDDVGCTSEWVTGGYLGLTGDGTNSAIRDQTLTVAAGDQGTEHGFRITVIRGEITVRFGSSAGGNEYLKATLSEGVHSLAVTPTGANLYVRIECLTEYRTLVDSIAIESAGAMTIPTSFDSNDLDLIRYTPSGDVLFLACDGQIQHKIERRTTRSWSFVTYYTTNGPFRTVNTSPITLAPSGLSGDITLTSNKDFFESSHVGAIFAIDSQSQTVEEDISTEDVFTDPIRVTGAGYDRLFYLTLTGLTGTGNTVTLQRSLAEPGSWQDCPGSIYTSDGTGPILDGLDNVIYYYRIGIKAGDYSSGTTYVNLVYNGGTITGNARVVGVTNGTTATAIVLKNFGGTDATKDWYEGVWSDYRGWPGAVTIHGGRLWWAGKDWYTGSVSDGYYNFDPDYEGDAGPIVRTIGQGPTDVINWLMSAQTMITGAEGQVRSVRSSSIDEPITPTNFDTRLVISTGSAAIQAEQVDKSTIMVQSGGTKVFELSYEAGLFDYNHSDLTAVVPEIGEPSITRMGFQRLPDIRVHFVRSDGKVAILVFDKAEEVKCWVLFETDGDVIDVVVSPGTIEDDVYYVVERSGGTYLEKWAKESEAIGETINKVSDSFVTYSGASTTTITGLGHLEGETVVVWGNGKDLGSYTVSSGSITLSEAVTYCVVGLSYTAQWKSVKMASITGSFGKSYRVTRFGALLANTHYQGLEFGPDFDNLDGLPLTEDYATVDDDTMWETYHESDVTFPGTFDEDARICLQATAPRPATVLALFFEGV